MQSHSIRLAAVSEEIRSHNFQLAINIEIRIHQASVLPAVFFDCSFLPQTCGFSAQPAVTHNSYLLFDYANAQIAVFGLVT